MPKKEDDVDYLKDIPHTRTEPRPDFSQPLPRKSLPKALEDTLNDEEKLWQTLSDGNAPPSTDSSIRYAAYATRFRTILLSAHRYVAYTSDVGESFRPIAHPRLVTGAYAISWAYLVGDVAHEGYKAYLRNQQVLHPEAHIPGPGSKKTDAAPATETTNPNMGEVALAATTDLVKPGKVAPIDDYRTVMVQRALFQSIASMALPAFTIHSVVKYSGKALKDASNKTIRTWGPIGLGLAAVPALPYMFDKPVEEVIEYVFHKGFELAGGPEAASQVAKDKKEL